MLITLDTPHGPNTNFLKKCPKNGGKMRGKIIFSPLWCLIQKLDHNSGLHAKNQREISKNEVRSPPPPFVWKCGHSPLIRFFLFVLNTYLHAPTEIRNCITLLTPVHFNQLEKAVQYKYILCKAKWDGTPNNKSIVKLK